MYFTVWEEPDPVHYRLERGRPMYFTVWGGSRLRYFTTWEGPTHVLFRGKYRLLYLTVWEGPARVHYRLGGAGSGTLPCGRSRLWYFTDCRTGGSCNLQCDKRRLMCFTV